MKFIFKTLLPVAALAAVLAGCGEKTPEQIAEENKKTLSIAVKRAQVLMFENKYAQSAELLEEASRRCGDDATLCELLAYSYVRLGRGAEAAIFFEKASDISGGNAQLLVNAAKAYEQAGQFQSAIRAYEKYLKLKPRDMIAWKSMSKCLESLSNYREALNAYLEGLKKSERNPNTREACEIGNLFLKVGNAVQGRKWLEAALAATNDENIETRTEILTGLISVYLAQKETALLEDAVAKLDKIDPKIVDEKYPNLRAQLAEFRRKLKEAEDAVNAEKIAAEKREAEKKAQEGKAAKEKAQTEEKATEQSEPESSDAEGKNAEQAAQPAPESKPQESAKPAEDSQPADAPEVKEAQISDEVAEDTQPKTKLEKLVAQTYAQIADGKAAEASKSGNLAVAENRNSAQAWRALALAYDAEGRSFDSYMAARESYVRNPDDINATLLYIRTASGVQNNEQFLNTLYAARKKFPNNSEIMLGLARTYKLLGDKPNARFFYESFLNGTPKEHPLYDEVSEEFEKYIAEK